MARNITVIPANQNMIVASNSQSQRKLRVAHIAECPQREEQLLSYENQLKYYKNYIESNPNFGLQVFMLNRALQLQIPKSVIILIE